MVYILFKLIFFSAFAIAFNQITFICIYNFCNLLFSSALILWPHCHLDIWIINAKTTTKVSLSERKQYENVIFCKYMWHLAVCLFGITCLYSNMSRKCIRIDNGSFNFSRVLLSLRRKKEIHFAFCENCRLFRNGNKNESEMAGEQRKKDTLIWHKTHMILSTDTNIHFVGVPNRMMRTVDSKINGNRNKLFPFLHSRPMECSRICIFRVITFVSMRDKMLKTYTLSAFQQSLQIHI